MADNETLQAATYTARGTARDPIALPSDMFDGTINVPVMHQTVKAYLANQRQGTAATKIRKYVIGGNQKPWKQKGTGRARQGSTRAPHFRGGGTVFGPHPRDYTQRIPKQVKALARKSAFNARAREDALLVIDAFDYTAPKTSRLLELLTSLGVADRKVLILTDGLKPNVYLSGRNRPNVLVMPYSDASTYHVLWSQVVLVEAGALGQALEPIAEDEATPKAKAPRKSAAKSAAKKSAAADSATPKKRATRKKAADDSAAESQSSEEG